MADTSKRSDGAAAPTEPAAGLDACFGAMRLDDPPSLHRPQPKPEPLRVPVPTTGADVMQQFDKPQQQPPSYAVGEGSAAAQYASILGFRDPSIFFASHFGAYSPRFNDLAAQFPSVSAIIAPSNPMVSPSPSMPSSSNNHYQPTAPACLNPSTSAPPAGLINPYASYSQPRTAAAPSCSMTTPAWTRTPPSFLSELHASDQVVNYQPWTGMPAVRRVATPQEVRPCLLRSPMDPALVMSPRTAARVVRLLQEGGEEERRSVLAWVMSAVHGVMRSMEGRDVFVALLCACAMRFDELRGIVHAVCRVKDVLMDILNHDDGVETLNVLIVAVAPWDQLSEPLIFWLLRERLTEHCKCGEMLNHCFANIPYETCSIMIWFAIRNIDGMLSSASGSVYLAECFANARDVELRCLEVILLRSTSKIAMGEYSNYFLQRVLECGSDYLTECIAERVAEDVATLSADKFGSYVVEACFLLTFSLTPLWRVLVAFLHLPREQLAKLVQGSYSNYVVHKLLATGKRPFPKETTALARRIQKLPAAVQRDMHAHRVMRVIEKRFRRKPHY